MNIYVGNLDFKVTENDLEKLFEKFGAVESASVITDKYSGRSKGFGFVTMPDSAAAAAAIKELDGKPQNGRNLIVNEAKPKKNNSY
jgi:RNA recognition motif-containing protein